MLKKHKKYYKTISSKIFKNQKKHHKTTYQQTLKDQKKCYKTIYQQNIEELENITRQFTVNSKESEEMLQDNLLAKC